MSLSTSDQRALSSMETTVCAADPELASLHAFFAQLSAGEAMPGHERLDRPARRGRLRRFFSTSQPVAPHPGLWPANSPARRAAQRGPWPKWTCAGMPGPSRW
jgi:hypothetical protein